MVVGVDAAGAGTCPHLGVDVRHVQSYKNRDGEKLAYVIGTLPQGVAALEHAAAALPHGNASASHTPALTPLLGNWSGCMYFRDMCHYSNFGICVIIEVRDMCHIEIVGQAFLWHQIRCIMSILFHIGRGQEKSDVVKELLDVKTNPAKPSYDLASEAALVMN